MNQALSNLAQGIQQQAGVFIPKAYALGRAKAQRKYGVVVPWGDRDNVAVEQLLARHADELSTSMAAIDAQQSQGAPIDHLIDNLIGRVHSWSWALVPALAMGLATYVDRARGEIGATEQLEPNDIGIIWSTAGDARVCKTCDYLNGRWFDAKEAYALAATVHRGCRCPAHWDVGTPDEALVGPIPGYKPGTAQDIYRDLGIQGAVQARHNAGRQTYNKMPKPSEYARPNIQT